MKIWQIVSALSGSASAYLKTRMKEHCGKMKIIRYLKLLIKSWLTTLFRIVFKDTYLKALLIHNWTKFTRSEYPAYRKRFYGPGRGKADEDLPADLRIDYDRAWKHHQKANDHHWQYWLLFLDRGGKCPLYMPDAARKEMIADWIGAGKAYHSPMREVIHPQTYAWIEKELERRFGYATSA